MPPEAASSALDTSAANLDPNAAQPATSAPATQTSSPTEYWGKGILKEDGSFDHSRWDKAPDDIKDVAKDFSKFKNWDDAAKAWKGKNELLGRKGIAEPLGKDATPEQRAEHMSLVRKAVGAPDKPEGYVIEKPKDLPDAAWDKEAIGKAAQIAFEEGVSPAALQKLAHYEVQRQIEAARASETAMKAMWEGQDKLIREFAAKQGMDYATAKGFAENAGRKWGVEADSPFMQNATVFALLTRLGKAGGEAPLVKGDTNEDNLASLTPETALKALEAIRDDPKNPLWAAYWNRDPENPKKEKVHADHDKVVERVKNLSKLAYANRPMRTGR